MKTVTTLLDKIPNPLGKIEDVFDSRVAKTLKRLGVIPTVNALQALSEQVEKLTALIKEYVDTTPDKKSAVNKATAKAPVKRKPVAKKAEVKKTPTKKTPVNKGAS